MNERQARQEGLVYTGVSFKTFEKDKFNARKQELKEEFPKARFIQVSCSDNYISLYADQVYNAYRKLRGAQETIAKRAERLEYYKKQYEEGIANCNAEYAQAQADVASALEVINKV